MLETGWTYATHEVVRSLLVDGEDCFVTGRNRYLLALHGATGEPRWSVRVLNTWGSLAATRGRVFYLNQHSRLVALDRETGDALWTRDLPNYYGWLHAYGETVVVGGWRGYTDIFALDAAEGGDRWTLPATQTSLHSCERWVTVSKPETARERHVSSRAVSRGLTAPRRRGRARRRRCRRRAGREWWGRDPECPRRGRGGGRRRAATSPCRRSC